jgi:hypothetical protein
VAWAWPFTSNETARISVTSALWLTSTHCLHPKTKSISKLNTWHVLFTLILTHRRQKIKHNKFHTPHLENWADILRHSTKKNAYLVIQLDLISFNASCNRSHTHSFLVSNRWTWCDTAEFPVFAFDTNEHFWDVCFLYLGTREMNPCEAFAAFYHGSSSKWLGTIACYQVIWIFFWNEIVMKF